MIKILSSLFLILIFGHAAFSQNPLRLRIVDKNTSQYIKEASVNINEIPSPNKFSDENGLVVYNNVPGDRKVRVNVRKDGYKPVSVEMLASPNSRPDNYYEIDLEKDLIKNKVVIYGKIEDRNEQNIANNMVVISFIGQSLTTTTDKVGNYRFEVPVESFELVKSFIIEVEHAGCEKYKVSEDYQGGFLINKDIRLNCGENTNPSRPADGARQNTLGRELSGSWVGKLTLLNQSDTYNLLFTFKVINGEIIGTSLMARERNQYNYCKFSISGKYVGNDIVINEIAYSEGSYNSWVVKQFVGNISQEDGNTVFSGKWNNDSYKVYYAGKIVVNATNSSGGYFSVKHIAE